MSIRNFLSLVALVALTFASRNSQAQFTSPVQSPLQVGGTTNRYAASGTYFNGQYYVAYTAQNGSVYLTSSSTLSFTSATAITTPAGTIQSSGSPSITAVQSQLFLSYIVGNSSLYITHSVDGSNWSTPTLISLPSGVVPDATPSMASYNSVLLVGIHNHTNQTIVVCSVNWSSFASTCSQPASAGSTYGPGLVTVGGTLYTFFESSNSSHSLYYFVTNINADGSLPQFTLYTTTSTDQTSGQPSAAYLNNQVMVGFRSNDSSAHFLTKIYNIPSNVWSSSADSGVSINGAPNLLNPSSVGGGANNVVNFFVPNSSPYYLETMHN